jgi:hypothetical protein
VFVEGKANELYLDGELVARTPHSQTSLRSTRSPLRIGNRHWLGSDWNPFVGDIDHVRIYRGVVLGMDTRPIPSDVPPIEDQRSALRQMKMTVVLPAYCDSPDRPTPFKCEAGPRTVPFVVDLRDEQGNKLTGAKVAVKVNGAGVSPPSFSLVDQGDQGAPDRWDLWANDGIYANANTFNTPGEVGMEFAATKAGYETAVRTLSGKATQPEPPWGNVTLAMLHAGLRSSAPPEETRRSRMELAQSCTDYYRRNTANGLHLSFTQYPVDDSWLALAHCQADYRTAADRVYTAAWALVCRDAVIAASLLNKFPLHAGLRGIRGVIVRSDFPSGDPVTQSNLAHIPSDRRTQGVLVHEIGHLLGFSDTYYTDTSEHQDKSNVWDLMSAGSTLEDGSWIGSRPRLQAAERLGHYGWCGGSRQPATVITLGEPNRIPLLERAPTSPVAVYPEYSDTSPYLIFEVRSKEESPDAWERRSLLLSSRAWKDWGKWVTSRRVLIIYACLPPTSEEVRRADRGGKWPTRFLIQEERIGWGVAADLDLLGYASEIPSECRGQYHISFYKRNLTVQITGADEAGLWVKVSKVADPQHD